jgi:hypothetical protein
MANNRIQFKRTSTSGRTANVTSSGNTQYIAAGELALNMADGILYTSNGSSLITVGANQVNQSVTGTLTVNAISSNGGLGTAGQTLHSNGSSTYWATDDAGTGTVTNVATGNGMSGGPITATGTLVAVAGAGVVVNASGINVLSNNGITSNSTGTFVTQGSGVSVNSTGVHVLANTGIVSNTTGTFVNASYIATISANNASYLGGTIASGYQTTAGLSANVATLTSNNATNAFGKTEGALNVNSALTSNNSSYFGGQLPAYYTNATNITTGTLPYAQIPANVINTTAAFTRTGITTFSANVVLGSSGVSSNGSFGTAGQILSSNGTATYWATAAAATVNTAAQYTWTNTQTYASAPYLNNDTQLRFKTVNTAAYSYFVQQNDDNFVFYTTNASYGARAIWSTFANSSTSNFDIAAPIKINDKVFANGVVGTAGQVLTTNTTGVYWSSVGGTGTVTQVNTGNGMTGGPITGTGTVSVLAGTGIVANATGVHVNPSYVQNTDSRTLSGNLTFTGSTTEFQSAVLGNTATNLANNLSMFTPVDGNSSFLKFYHYRHTTGTGWTNASTRIQQRIDTTDMGYVEFNPSGFNQGLGLYGGSGKGLTINQTGQSTFGNTVILGSVGVSSNGSVGTAGQVLTSNGSASYWSTSSSTFDYGTAYALKSISF